MAERTGKCTRFGNCSTADAGTEVSIADGADPVCPECGRELMVKHQGVGRTKLIGGVIALLVVAAIGFGAVTFFGGDRAAPVVPAVTPMTTPSAPSAAVAPPVPLPAVAPPAPVPAPAPLVFEDMVNIADFWIDKTEVSVGAFKVVFPRYKAPQGFTDDMPVVDVTWADAQRFAQQSAKRLCRDREWLFALGEVPDLAGANLDGDTTDRPRPVADERDRNGHGLLNMVGNVSEWVDSGGDEAAFLGGYWYWNKEGRSEYDLTRVNRLGTKQAYHHYIGFRRCRDAVAPPN